MKRKDFLQSVLGASAFIGLSLAACNEKESLQELVNNTKKEVNGSMFGFAADPIQKVRIKIRKPHAPIMANLDTVEVELTRKP